MLTPFPTQVIGAAFLSKRQNALLADAPRVGKTGTAILAADDCLDENILVVTTASGRPVWNRAFPNWSPFGRSVQVITSAAPVKAQVGIVGWPSIANNNVRAELLKRRWDRIILDEAHAAKNFETARTKAAYGLLTDGGLVLNTRAALIGSTRGTWTLTGTPLPHDPSDIYPMMRAMCPERLLANPAKGWPDVTRYEDFRDRYCKWRPKKLSRWRTIIVIMGGKNEDELAERLEGFLLRRTQQDVGIRAPIYDIMPLAVSPRMLRDAEADVEASAMLAAAKSGDTRKLEIHLGPLRRMTGTLKAQAVIEAVKDEFDGGLDKIVLAYWHRDVGQILKDGLAEYGVAGIDGDTPSRIRGEMEQRFLTDPGTRVFLGQIQAAGEAIDLSSAATLWFVESSFVPKDMAQMALRITNHTQSRQAFVKVCVLEGSIDEALNEILMRLWASIREVLK